MGNISAQKMTGVYEPSTPSKSRPDRYMTFAEADRMVKQGSASFINHNKAIRLERALEPDPGWDSTKRFGRPGGAEGLSASGQFTGLYLAAINSRRCPGLISEGAIAAAESWTGPMKSGDDLKQVGAR